MNYYTTIGRLVYHIHTIYYIVASASCNHIIINIRSSCSCTIGSWIINISSITTVVNYTVISKNSSIDSTCILIAKEINTIITIRWVHRKLIANKLHSIIIISYISPHIIHIGTSIISNFNKSII